MTPSVPNSTLQESYFLESLIWRHLDKRTPLFSFVQDPIFNLTPAEVVFLTFLHSQGLKFILRPRYDPSSFIHMNVTLDHTQQNVRLEIYQGLATTCVFITERSSFANYLKGWLDRHLGSEHFTASHYVATRQFVHYPYVLPIESTLIEQALRSPDEFQLSLRFSKLFFNFTSKENYFLDMLKRAVETCAVDQDDPVYVQVYPRQSSIGSIELVINNRQQRQPVRIFISGYHPVAYQIITEKSELGLALRDCLDSALGTDNFDSESSRLRSKYLSLIYNVRYSLDQLDDFDEDEENSEDDE